MLNQILKRKNITDEERIFLMKTSQYLIKNCKAIYGQEYIPVLVQRICKFADIDMECWGGIIEIVIDGDKHYRLPYAFNVFKHHAVDLGLFVIKKEYGQNGFGINYNLAETSIFNDLPSFAILNFKGKDLPKNVKISYEKKNYISSKYFRPNQIMSDDKLVFAIYDDNIASNIAQDISESTLDMENLIKPEINFIEWS